MTKTALRLNDILERKKSNEYKIFPAIYTKFKDMQQYFKRIEAKDVGIS